MGNLYPSWLVDAARLTGYPVVPISGWERRGHGGMRVVEGMVLHHTADGPGEYPSLRVVRDGRADLAGPLCNFGLGRSGTIYVVAAGCAWHAGASKWAGFTDLNDEFLGVEAESRGSVDDWTDQQRDAYPRLAAACMYYIRRGADRVGGHKEVCLPKGRKIDPAFWNLAGFRDRVAYLLADPLHRIPKGGGSPTVDPAKPTVPSTPRRLVGDDQTMHEYTPMPPADAHGNPTTKKDTWPTRTISYGFDPDTTKDIRLHWGSLGGWIHSARWWVRDPGWSANAPKHHPVDHNVGAGGSERWVGYGWVAGYPAGADELEVTFSAPSGLHMFPALK